jgi:hypothetical protein
MFSFKHIVVIATSTFAVALPATVGAASAASPGFAKNPVLVSSKPIAIADEVTTTGLPGGASEETCGDYNDKVQGLEGVAANAAKSGDDELAFEAGQTEADEENLALQAGCLVIEN